ncbi:unnamed protein product [Symbiodinium sp. CCMP2592]|nr:unnamed protein product [Symbiodinium sp. CCMP2592]
MSSDNARTPRKASATSASPDKASPSETPSAKKTVQYGLGRFWSPSDKDKPVLEATLFSGKRDRRTTEHRIQDTLQKLVTDGVLKVESDASLSMEPLAKRLKASMTSGRPRKNPEELRGTAGGKSSNRRYAGQTLLRQEIPVAVKDKMCQQILSQVAGFASMPEFFRHFAAAFDMSLDKLKEMYSLKDAWAATVKKLNLSTSASVCHKEAGLKHGKRGHAKPRLRQPGGGRKKDWPEAVDACKTFLEMERAHGHTVLKRHLLWRFCEEVEKLGVAARAEAMEMSELDPRRRPLLKKAEKAQQQVKRLLSNDKLGLAKAGQVAEWVGAKDLCPNLKTTMSEIEQRVSAELTWQAHDADLRLLAYGNEEELKPLFAKPSEFMAVKKTSSKELFAEFEHAARPQSEVRSATRNLLADFEAVSEEPGRLSLVAQPQPAELSRTGKKHPTTRKDPDGDRYRLTYEARQGILHYFDESKDPVGVVLPGMVIVAGVHAELSNIDERGLWRTTRTFQYGGQVIQQKAGMSAGRTLYSWRLLRQRRPELMSEVEVYSQPAAMVDSVIMCWCIARAAETYASSYWIRDCLKSAFTEEAGKARFAAHQLQGVVAAKMTSQLQVTDTDFSSLFKKECLKCMDNLRYNGQKQTEGSTVWKPSSEDMLTAIVTAQRVLSEKNQRDGWVLASCRRNGFLALRPTKDGFVRSDEQSWARDLPLGSSRISSAWLTNRLTHWLEGAADLADLLEWDFVDKSDKEKTDLVLPIDDKELEAPEWSQLAGFQLSLDLRRSRWLKANKELQSEKAPWLSVLKAIVPLAGKGNQAKNKKKKKKKKKKKLSFAKKQKLSVKKNVLRQQVRRLKVAKQPLPDAPASAPVALPEEAPTFALVALPDEAPPSGVFRVVSDVLGESCYGLTGTLQKATATDGLLLPLKKGKSQWVPRSVLHLLLDIDGAEEVDNVEIVQPDTLPRGGLRDQTMAMGWEAIGWALGCDDSVVGVNPVLTHFFLQHQQYEADPEHGPVVTELHRLLSTDKLVLFPVYASHHWTLLCVDKRAADVRVKYFDSLTELHEPTRAKAEQLLVSLLHDRAQQWLPLTRHNLRVRQTPGKVSCGLFVLSWMESEAADAVGYGPCAPEWPSTAVVTWHERLRRISLQLVAEKAKFEGELQKELEAIVKAAQ